MKIGIVGLPNVGKSTLFNALTKSQNARAANFPFCTIDPNVGIVDVPDSRLQVLAKMVNPGRIVPASVEFVDIAGLVQGASKGEGLGNQFLAHIRECNAIAQVVRLFVDDDLHHVHGTIDPKRDIEVIQTELILADMQTLEKRVDKARSEARSGKEDAKTYCSLLERLLTHLQAGNTAASLDVTDEEKNALRDLYLITAKPFLYVVNISEDQIGKVLIGKLKGELGLADEVRMIPVSAKIEAELMQLSPTEADVFLKEYGLNEPGLNRLIKEAYDILGYQTYFTAGPMEVRAWTTTKGDTAPKAASKIHTDFEKGFIRAEVIAYEDFVKYGGEKGARDAGKMRSEGKDYIVADGDLILFLTSK